MSTPKVRFFLLVGFLALICAAMILPGCARVAGVVDFTASPTSGKRPLSVQFTPAVEGSARRWIWNFGDGQTSTQRSPEHIYSDAGAYSVILTVIPRRGEPTSMMKTDYITVQSGFGGSPASLIVEDDDFTLGLYSNVPSFINLGGDTVYVLDVLDNDVPGDGAAGLTIVGVSTYGDEYDEHYCDTDEGTVSVSHDRKTIEYQIFDLYLYNESFYYLVSDGQTTAEGEVSIGFSWDDGTHAP